MKKTISFIFSLYLLFAGFSLFAQDTINVSIIDGHVNIYDGYYTIGNTSTDYKGSYLFTGSTTNEYYIKINPGDYADTTFTFKDIAMNSGSGNGGMLLMQTKVMLNFIGNNHIESKRGLFQNTDTLAISGDSLEAIANSNYSAIGPASLAGSIIELNNKYSYAFTTSTRDPAIGAKGTKCDSIVIKGTTTTAISGYSCDIRANHICINGGSVKGTLSQTAVNTNGDSIYCVVVPHNGKLSIGLNDGIKDSTLTFFAHHPADDNFYIYLPNGSYSFSNGDGNTYTAIVNGANTIATVPAMPGDGIIDVSQGKAVIIKDTAYYIGAQPYVYKGHKFVLTGKSTTGNITVFSKLADTLTFQNLCIEMEAGCAFSLQTGNDITIALEGTNTLKSTGTFAGLEKDSTAGVLTICGPDTLIASGGIGIGNCWISGGIGCGDITINGGIIQVTGVHNGIGGSQGVKAGTITFNGGNITANCTGSPYTGNVAIGNALGGIIINGGNINANTLVEREDIYCFNTPVTINGGIVTTSSLQGCNFNSGITVNGGTIYAINEFQKTEYNEPLPVFSHGTFSGGSINLVGTDGITTSISSQPVNSDSTILYHSQYIVPDISKPVLVEAIIINDSISWGCKDVYTDSTGTLHLWMPVSDTSTVKITVNGTTYSYSGEIIAYNNYVAPDEEEGILEYGNCLWQLPVAITQNGGGVLTVKKAGSVVAGGSYVCNNSNLFIIGEPSENYRLDSIVVNGVATTNADTTITATSAVTVSAYFSLETSIGEQQLINAKVYTSGHLLYVDAEAGTSVKVYRITGALLTSTTGNGALQQFDLPYRGVCLVKLTGNQQSKVVKCTIR